MCGVSAFCGSGSCRRAGRGCVHPVPVTFCRFAACIRFRVFCIWFRIGCRFGACSGSGRGSCLPVAHVVRYRRQCRQTNICSVYIFLDRKWNPAAIEHLFDTKRLWLAYTNICSDRPSASTRSHRPSVGIGSGYRFSGSTVSSGSVRLRFGGSLIMTHIRACEMVPENHRSLIMTRRYAHDTHITYRYYIVTIIHIRATL